MLVTGTIDKINTIILLQDKMKYNDIQIARYLDMKVKELRKFRLNNEVSYRADDVKNNNYLSLAIEFNKLASEVYFPIELARLTNTSPYTANTICKMFNIKPNKKAFCQHCGEEVVVKSTAVPKYCSSLCRYRHKSVTEVK